VAAPTVSVVCGECGLDFELSKRNALGHRQRGTLPRCVTCRFPPKPPTPELLAEMKAWWLKQFTLDELRSWPPL
jgi:hypothetical protein